MQRPKSSTIAEKRAEEGRLSVEKSSNRRMTISKSHVEASEQRSKAKESSESPLKSKISKKPDVRIVDKFEMRFYENNRGSIKKKNLMVEYITEQTQAAERLTDLNEERVETEQGLLKSETAILEAKLEEKGIKTSKNKNDQADEEIELDDIQLNSGTGIYL
jgi:hypothetical protein